MPLGFSFRESLSGSYWLLEAPTDERVIAFAVEATAHDVRAFARDKTWRIDGTIDVEGIASAAPVHGRIVFRLFEERRISHQLEFAGDSGARYELIGQQEFIGLSPIESLTLLPASLCDDRGEEIGRATLRLDLRRDWALWIKSLRLRWEW